jgi:transcriptional regulator with XRE-family HTH domain
MIGKNIQLYRNIRGITQRSLANRIGAATGTLSHIERGSRKPSLDMLYRLADALNVSVINLLLDIKEIDRLYYDEQIQALYSKREKPLEVIRGLKAGNNNIYGNFALVYDIFMDNVSYDAWADYAERLLGKYGIRGGLLLELGCGTGNMTRRLADKGYDMIGIDSSAEMLALAREKNIKEKDRILYLCQDMREFELYGTVAAVISVCDSINYIIEEEDLLKVFRLVNNYLDPGGVFIFDLDTQYEYEEILGDKTIAESRSEGSFIWENTYYEEEMINEVKLTLFFPKEQNYDKQESGEKTFLFCKQEEIHYRRAYPLSNIRRLIQEAGLEWVAVYDALTEKAPEKDSERVYIIAREKSKSTLGCA